MGSIPEGAQAERIQTIEGGDPSENRTTSGGKRFQYARTKDTLRSLDLTLEVGPEYPARILECALGWRLQSLAQDPPQKIEVGQGSGQFIDESVLCAMHLDMCADPRRECAHPVLCLDS
jgi:hypothetical protein